MYVYFSNLLTYGHNTENNKPIYIQSLNCGTQHWNTALIANPTSFPNQGLLKSVFQLKK